MLSHPRFFVAVFGDPQVPDKSKVDSGMYDPDPRYAPFPTTAGDLMLLYCTGGYGGHEMEIPGLGVVLETGGKWIKYRWLPFERPIFKDQIDASFESRDLEKFKNIRFSSHWLFEISKSSFSETIKSHDIDWTSL